MVLIEWMETPEGRRYRAWTTVSDTYYHQPLTREEMVAWLVSGCRHTRESAEEVIERIHAKVSDGVSSGRVERWSVEYDAYGDPVEAAASVEAARALTSDDAD